MHSFQNPSTKVTEEFLLPVEPVHHFRIESIRTDPSTRQEERERERKEENRLWYARCIRDLHSCRRVHLDGDVAIRWHKDWLQGYRELCWQERRFSLLHPPPSLLLLASPFIPAKSPSPFTVPLHCPLAISFRLFERTPLATTSKSTAAQTTHRPFKRSTADPTRPRRRISLLFPLFLSIPPFFQNFFLFELEKYSSFVSPLSFASFLDLFHFGKKWKELRWINFVKKEKKLVEKYSSFVSIIFRFVSGFFHYRYFHIFIYIFS